MKIKSERLSLIDFREELLSQNVMSWFTNPVLMKYYTNSKRKITREGLITSIKEGAESKDSFTYFIVHNETEKLIGTIKLGPILKAHRISDLVTLIGEQGNIGKGVGTEAIKLGVRLAFEVHDLRKLFGGMYASNIASIKAYTRAGWIVEGILKGHYWNDEKNEDRILVGCFNPKYFSKKDIEDAKYEAWYENDH